MNRQMKIGMALVGLVVIAAVLAPWLAPYSYQKLDLPGSLGTPGAKHLLGQDELGRDILSRLVYGARVSVSIGLMAVSVSAMVGIIIGLLAGFFGKTVDMVIMRVIDILMAFPGILLAIALTAVLGPSYFNVVFALSVLGWVGYARLVRAQALSERERDYVQAARALGAGKLRIAFRHVLPNIMAPVMVQAMFGLGGAILAEASLSFLGLGVQGYPSWGAMLNSGTDYLLEAPHLSTFPGMAILIAVMGFNFLGDGLRDRLDPTRRHYL
jgi:peptide/nickel transport system permease protein